MSLKQCTCPETHRNIHYSVKYNKFLFQWCFNGQCVTVGQRPEAIHGEWGEWIGWTECTRDCGGGVSHNERHCDNPV